MNHARRQIDHTHRRVMQGQKMPQQAPVFAIFEPHPAWLKQGKAGVPVARGGTVWVVEEHHQLRLHQRVMPQAVEVEVAVIRSKATPPRCPDFASCSVDQGLHSPSNQRQLAGWLETVILPKQGRRSKPEQERPQPVVLIEGRCQHAAVESALHALEVHGVERCPDPGLPAFERYVAVAVVARNLHILGRYLQQREQAIEKERWKIAA